MPLEPQDWFVGIIGALLIGFGKGGIPGAGNLSIPLYALAFGPRESVGIILPVLIFGDIVAVRVYHHHADWRHILRLLPWALPGILSGFLILKSGLLQPQHWGLLLGGLLLAMSTLHFFLRGRERSEETASTLPHSKFFAAAMGFLAGFSTMLANAAGPVGALYLLSVGLPKYAFIGTQAWFFFIVNVIKLPFQANAGLLSASSLAISLPLGLAAAAGAALAPRIVKFIPQKLFEHLMWFFVALAALKLLF
jgi:uncharacterized protein